MNNPKLARAVKLALLASAAGAIALPAAAQDEDDVIEEIVTTGSRIKQDVSDAPRPITVLDRMDIEMSGLENVADVLRTTTYNTFGSFRERSGTSFGQVALVSLRGLGADYTAILINGRRVPGNPITGGSSVDLNSIPLSSVERIELLTDSASAIYGADAIGGVINIIFREDFEGAEFEVGMEAPSAEGAETKFANFTVGTTSEKGAVMFSAEWFRRDPIFDASRDYSKVIVRPNPSGMGLPRLDLDTSGVSAGGNTAFETDFSMAYPIGACPTDTYIPIQDPFGIPGDGCGFGYGDRSMMTGGVDRKSTFLNARYEVAPGHSVYVENRYTNSQTFGRYAPAVGFFFWDEASPTNTFGRDMFAFSRFVGHGNRDETFAINELDTVVGLQGSLGDSDISYDVFGRYYDYSTRNVGSTYVITSILEDEVLAGNYDLLNPLSQDPGNLASIGRSSATLSRDISSTVAHFGITFDGSMFELPAGRIGWAAGAEYADITYQDQYDALREAGNITGSAGNSAAGDRTRKALFGEVQIPIFESLEANIAVRYDDYSDFGSQTSPQINLRWMPFDMLTFRASYGQGFKAPNLSDLHGKVGESFNFGRDYVRCDAQGVADADCGGFQYQNFSGGNIDLQAEESESFNVGVIVEPLDGLRLSVDYYQIELTNKVNGLSVQEAINLQRDGVALPSGVNINRAAPNGNIPGVIINLDIPLANLTSQKVRGYDIRAQYNIDTDNLGNFGVGVDYSRIEEYSEITLAGQPRVEFAGTYFAPKYQAAVNLRWIRNAFSANLISRLIGSHDEGNFDSYARHDLTLTYTTPWDGDITFGVRNLTDEGPVLANDGTGWNGDGITLYDTAGITPFLRYKHRL